VNNATSTVIPLKFPTDVAGVKVTSLTMRRPKVRDLLAVEDSMPSASESQRERALFANLCMVTPDAIGELDLVDYAELQKRYMGFLSGGGAPTSSGANASSSPASPAGHAPN
jgi:hypothetical protein